MRSKWDNKLTHSEREQTREDLYRRFSERGLRRQHRRRMVLKLIAWFLLQAASGAKRVLDLAVAALLITILSPLLVTGFLVGGRELRRTARVGRWCESFDELSFVLPEGGLGRFMAGLRLHSLPVLINILKGDMSFVGPRRVSPGDLSPRERTARKRFNVRPGLICLWWVRRRVNIAFDSEVESDEEYVDGQTVWGDFGLALRAIPAALYGEVPAETSTPIRILGVQINNLTMSEAVDSILSYLSGEKRRKVCFVNADCVNIACRDRDYFNVLKESDLTLADGIGLKIAGKLLGRDIKQNVNGTDLFPRLCARLSGTGHGMFLLGASPGVAESVRDWVEQNYPQTIISGCHHGYFSPAEEPEVIKQIAASGATLLLVALGAPRQEKWINMHLDQTRMKVAIGVGGLFEFYSGSIPRAPLWVREMGFEWLYRFLQEPRRMWKRYFWGNSIFLFRVIKEKLTGEV